MNRTTTTLALTLSLTVLAGCGSYDGFRATDPDAASAQLAAGVPRVSREPLTLSDIRPRTCGTSPDSVATALEADRPLSRCLRQVRQDWRLHQHHR